MTTVVYGRVLIHLVPRSFDSIPFAIPGEPRKEALVLPPPLEGSLSSLHPILPLPGPGSLDIKNKILMVNTRDTLTYDWVSLARLVPPQNSSLEDSRGGL